VYGQGKGSSDPKSLPKFARTKQAPLPGPERTVLDALIEKFKSKLDQYFPLRKLEALALAVEL